MNNKHLAESQGNAAPLDFAAANESLSEFAQAKVRCYLNVVLMSLALIAYYFQPALGIDRVFYTFCATAGSAAFLFAWAWGIQTGKLSGKWRFAQRVTSILLDNICITWILWFGGQGLAGIYGIYIWISVGYGLRYGLPWLYANLITSVVGFSIGGYFSPFWSQFPGLFGGLIFALIIVPVYTGFLIKRLNQTTAERETAFRAKSEFIARMSHELRTPLHGIISTADLMHREPLTAGMREKMRMISVSSTSLLELINKVLDISKFESGKVELVTQSMDLHAVIVDAATIVLPKASEKGLQIHTYIDPHIEHILIGPPHQLGEVLVNLAGNAAKFTEAGYIGLRALYLEEDEEQICVRFEIADTGPGIPKEQLSHIFETFAQADDSITRKHGGTGLGTAIAKEIVNLMGGEILVESTVDIGTKFWFDLAFKKHTERAEVQAIYPVEVIVIGEARDYREGLCTILQKFGTTFRYFETIAQFESALSEPNGMDTPDAIYIDVRDQLNTLGSISYQIFQSTGSEKTVPLIAVGFDSQRVESISAGFTAFVKFGVFSPAIERTLSITRAYKQDYADTTTLKSDISGLNILLADDNSTNQRIAQLTLEEAGHKCTVVNNGKEFLEKLEDEEFDVGILDMHMPIMDGVEVAKIFHFTYFDREMPLMMMTADNRVEARAAADGAGIDKFLTKPLKPSALVSAISDVCGSKNTEEIVELDRKVRSMKSTSGRTELLDRAELEELIGYMQESEALSFFEEFFEDAERQIRALEIDIRESKIDHLKNEMHSLSGAAAAIGAIALCSIARHIEFMNGQEIIENAEQLRTELLGQYEITRETIRTDYLAKAGVNVIDFSQTASNNKDAL